MRRGGHRHRKREAGGRRALAAGAALGVAACTPEQEAGGPADVLVVAIEAVAPADAAAWPLPEDARVGEAIAPAPLALPAAASLLTGLAPACHGLRDDIEFTLSDDVGTLAERLAAAGWATGGFVSTDAFAAGTGLERGFERYDDDVVEGAMLVERLATFRRRPAREVVDRALDWLGTRRDEAARRPTFTFVHLAGPHPPEDPSLDDALADLLSAADEGTLLVVAGLHGPGPDGVPHGLSLDDASVLVPLALAGPGAPDAVAPPPVALQDVAPTVLAAAGLPGPEAPEGCGGLPVGAAPADRAVAVESLAPLTSYGWPPLRGVRTAGAVLVVGDTVELSAPPGADAEALRAELRARLDALLPPPDPASAPPAAAAVFERLGGRWPEPAGPPPAPRAEVARALAGAVALLGAARPEAALEQARRADARWGTALTARFVGEIAGRLGRFPLAADALRRAVDRDPSDPAAWMQLAAALEQLGRDEEALEAWSRAVEADPHHRAGRAGRWALLRRLGRTERLRDELLRALAADPGDSEARVAAIQLLHPEPAERARTLAAAVADRPCDAALQEALGLALLALGRTDEGFAAFERAVAADPGRPLPSIVLARRALDRDDAARARALLEPALERAPDSPELLVALAEARARTDAVHGAARLLDRAAAVAPTDARVWATWGALLLDLGRPAAALPLLERARALGSRDARVRRNLAAARAALSRSSAPAPGTGGPARPPPTSGGRTGSPAPPGSPPP